MRPALNHGQNRYPTWPEGASTLVFLTDVLKRFGTLIRFRARTFRSPCAGDLLAGASPETQDTRGWPVPARRPFRVRGCVDRGWH